MDLRDWTGPSKWGTEEPRGTRLRHPCDHKANTDWRCVWRPRCTTQTLHYTGTHTQAEAGLPWAALTGVGLCTATCSRAAHTRGWWALRSPS